MRHDGVPVRGGGFESSPPGERSNCIFGGRRAQQRHTKDVRALFFYFLSAYVIVCDIFPHMFLLPASFLGVIERDIRSYPSSLPSTHRANMMGRSRPQEYQQSEGLIKVRGRFPQEKKRVLALSGTKLPWPASAKPCFKSGALRLHVSEKPSLRMTEINPLREAF